jgi:hypothetical protein
VTQDELLLTLLQRLDGPAAWRLADRPVKSGREPHVRPRVALTLPHFCANEPDRREHG